ncbi:ubiquitin-conjugating enzyme E2 36 [Tanacetum coccineum]
MNLYDKRSTNFDMQDMKNCYDGLLPASTAAVNSMYGTLLICRVCYELLEAILSDFAHFAIGCCHQGTERLSCFDKAQPLYLEAITILEKSYGHVDIRLLLLLTHLAAAVKGMVSQLGRICLDVLKDKWSLALQIRTVLMSVVFAANFSCAGIKLSLASSFTLNSYDSSQLTTLFFHLGQGVFSVDECSKR